MIGAIKKQTSNVWEQTVQARRLTGRTDPGESAHNNQEKRMKTNQLSNLVVPGRARKSFFRNLFISTLMIALFLTSLPTHAALAAPASDGITIDTKNFEQAWSNKIDKVRYNSIFYQRVRVYPSGFEDSAELATAHDILNNYGAALRTAQRIILNHAGFNEKGKVVNATQADQSLKDLSEQLRLMRVLKEKLDRLEGNYTLLPMSALATTASQ
jgi:hypothetical protein